MLLERIYPESDRRDGSRKIRTGVRQTDGYCPRMLLISVRRLEMFNIFVNTRFLHRLKPVVSALWYDEKYHAHFISYYIAWLIGILGMGFVVVVLAN
jgi:hypothetical protein